VAKIKTFNRIVSGNPSRFVEAVTGRAGGVEEAERQKGVLSASSIGA